MKITVNVDCTPDEARQFMGLPDVKPFQEEMMKLMRAKALENMKMMEPEAAMKVWAPMMNQGMSQGMDFFKNIMAGAATSAMNKSSRKKGE
jgi:Family of unknown function (DUF6489)